MKQFSNPHNIMMMVISILFFFLFSCSADGTMTGGSISTMNISGSNTLLIVPKVLANNQGNNESTRTVSSENNVLYKMDASGTLVAVVYNDIDGNAVTLTDAPLHIYNINTTYLIITYGVDQDTINNAYMVNKSSGAVYSLKTAGMPYPQKNTFRNGKHVYSDGSGNIYYRAATQNTTSSGDRVFEVAKIDITDPENITKTGMTSPVDTVDFFEIDNTGDILYYGSSANDDTVIVRRIVTPSKSVSNLAYPEDLFWQGTDGNLYISGSTSYYRLDIDGNSVTYVSNAGMISGVHSQKEFYKISCQGADYLFKAGLGTNWSTTGSDGTKVYPSHSIVAGNSFGLDLISIRYVKRSNTHIYLAGLNPLSQPKLLKIDGTDLATNNNLYTPGDYDIFNLSVSDVNDVTFNALRFSDSAVVLGNIDTSNDLTILNAQISNTIVALERID